MDNKDKTNLNKLGKTTKNNFQPNNPIENPQSREASFNNENWNIQGIGDIDVR